MFKIDRNNLSKFKTTNCENIYGMFSGCSSLESIDILNWDMNNINNINYLFDGCFKLKNIKMNLNNNKKLSFISTFFGLPKDGSIVYKKGANSEEILKKLPKSWNKIQE